MQIKKIEYSKLFSLGNFENEKIGVEIEINSDDDVQNALNEAKKFVELSSKNFADKLRKCKEIVNNPENHYVRTVNEARDFLVEYESQHLLKSEA